jgi:hypothetical protein
MSEIIPGIRMYRVKLFGIKVSVCWGIVKPTGANLTERKECDSSPLKGCYFTASTFLEFEININFNEQTQLLKPIGHFIGDADEVLGFLLPIYCKSNSKWYY